MNKIFLDNSIIKNELLRLNSFWFSLFWLGIPGILFLIILGCGIYSFVIGDTDTGITLFLCLLIPVVIALILNLFLDVKQSFTDYKNIKNGLFKVKKATCIETKITEFFSDGTEYEHTWLFENGISIKKNSSKPNLFDTFGMNGDEYLLVFINNHKYPELFYNTKQYEYSESET